MTRPEAWPRALTVPLGWLYRRVAGARNAAYDRGWLRAAAAPLPVVAIGNISFGGTGKTPATIWLARELAGSGRRVAILSRGYGRRAAGPEPLVVGEGGRVLTDAAAGGDEPVLLAMETGALVIVGPDRARSAALAARRGADVALLDDGFQHRRLARDLDLVLVDVTDGSGLLREPAGGLRRAGVILATHAPADRLLPRPLTLAEAPALVRRAARGTAPGTFPPVFAAEHRAQALELPDGSAVPPETLAGRVVLAVSGIARPDRFEETLRSFGAIVVGHVAFPDHHAFDQNDAAAIARRARESGARHVVTTTKDAVRWPAGAPEAAVLRIGLHVPAGDEVLRIVMSRIARR